MKEYVFRMYDIRGEVEKDFSVDDIGRCIRSFCAYLNTYYPAVSTVALGRDGRIHSPALHHVVCHAFRASGFTVFDLGMCPTPLVHFAVHTAALDIGCMITASHNGPSYNGLKLTMKEHSFWGVELQKIGEWYRAGRNNHASHEGTVHDASYLKNQYISWLCAQFSELKGMQQNIIFDCGNGATGELMEMLCRQMEWDQVQLLYADIDGTFPHHEADPIVAENMQDLATAVMIHQSPYGIGFDGDGDRMGVVTDKGALVSGDYLFLLFTQALLAKHAQARVVYDAKCSHILMQLINGWGGEAHMVPSGYANIRNAMRSVSAVFGGELSCHFFFKDRYFGYDDGMYSALRFIELMQNERMKLSEKLTAFPRSFLTSEWRMPFPEERKMLLVESVCSVLRHHPAVIETNTCDGIRASTSDGWFLLRASHTQPVICLRCEARTAEGLTRLKALITEVVSPYVEHEGFSTQLAVWIEDACRRAEC